MFSCVRFTEAMASSYGPWSIPALKTELRRRGARISSRKAELVERCVVINNVKAHCVERVSRIGVKVKLSQVSENECSLSAPAQKENMSNGHCNETLKKIGVC